MKCPLCGFYKKKSILDLTCPTLDASAMYTTVRIRACKRCGHIYNELSPQETAALEIYYEKESAPGNVNAKDHISDRPGSSSVLARKRYAALYTFLLPYLEKGMKIVDAGCATGGFLDYLWEKKFKLLYGFDMSKEYVRHAERKPYTITVGRVEKMPFRSSSIDAVVMDQVMEHLVDLKKAIMEAKRILTPNGLLCISIPDAARYYQSYFSDFYWMLLKEHIQHFDIHHLRRCAAEEGFLLEKFVQYRTPMMSETMILPVLSVVFRRAEKRKPHTCNNFSLQRNLERYIASDLKKMDKKKKFFAAIASSHKPVYAWGIGREFLYLYELAGLKKCNIAGLIDVSLNKQKYYSVHGRKIQDVSILKKAPPDSMLVISAVAHIKSIKEMLLKIGYSGNIVTF